MPAMLGGAAGGSLLSKIGDGLVSGATFAVGGAAVTPITNALEGEGSSASASGTSASAAPSSSGQGGLGGAIEGIADGVGDVVTGIGDAIASLF